MGRGGPVLVVLAAVGLAALVLGSALVENPGFVIPLFLESVALLLVTRWLLGKVGDREERRFLGQILGVAVALRAGVIGVVYGVLNPFFFAPDTATYAGRGTRIAQYWATGFQRPDILDRWQIGYEYLNAIAVRLLGNPEWAMVVLNSFAALWTVMLLYALARDCFGPTAGRIAAVLGAVFPSMVLWSVLNIRDSLATMTVTAIVLLGVRLYQQPKGRDLLLFGIGVLVLTSFRDYMGLLLLTGLLLGYGAAMRPGRLFSTLGMGTLLILVLFFALKQGEILTPEQLESPLASASNLRRGMQQDFVSGLAGSAIGVGYSIDTPLDALRYLPLGLGYFLFAPFPWAITSVLQTFTLPEVLLWYALVPFLVMGFGGVKARETRVSLLVLGVLLVTVTSYALVEGNFGTAYRHRAQVMPLFFVFVARGVSVWWARRKERLRQQHLRAARARVAVIPGRSKVR